MRPFRDAAAFHRGVAVRRYVAPQMCRASDCRHKPVSASGTNCRRPTHEGRRRDMDGIMPRLQQKIGHVG
jgi:hypothetical protein